MIPVRQGDARGRDPELVAPGYDGRHQGALRWQSSPFRSRVPFVRDIPTT